MVPMKEIGLALIGFCALIVALAVAAYSLMFPVWVYGLLYDREETDPGFFGYGLGAPFRDFPVSSFILVIIVLASGLGTIFVPRLLSLASTKVAILTAGSVALFIITCVGVYVFAHGIYSDAVALRKDLGIQRSMGNAMRNIGAASRQGRAPDVAYYRYLDQERVDSLYAQIEPEWLDKQTIVTDSSSASAKMGVGTGPVTGEIGKTGTQQKQTTREAAAATPEKKCHVIMQYASERKGARFYTVAFEWLILNLAQISNEHSMKPKPEARFGTKLPLSRGEMQELRLSGAFGMDNSPQMTEEINNDLRQRNWNNMLQGELTNLPEYLFVNGEFRISASPTLLLVHDFVGQDGNIGVQGERFRPVQVDVTFAPGAVAPELHQGTQKLTVFGKVVHGLDQQGSIEVRAVAVY